MRKIVVAVGPICVGKTTYASRFPSHWNKIDIGDIVRELLQKDERTHAPELDVQIKERLSKELAEGLDTIIVGIRQPSIANYIQLSYSKLDDLRFVILDAPQSVLEERFVKRAALKDIKYTFQDAVARDLKLGYNELIKYVREQDFILIDAF